MSSNYDQAVHWLEMSFEKDSPEAGKECLATAAVYGLLAIADAIGETNERSRDAR